MPSGFRWSIVLVALAVLPLLASPQQPGFSSATRIVSIPATVADAQGRLVPDLVKDDFEIYDNDKVQPIINFDNSVQPFSVIVFLDTSLSVTALIPRIKDAAEQFILRLLPQDKARVGFFYERIKLSPQFTNNRDELIKAVKDIDYGQGTHLWDAVSTGLDEFKGVEGRKIILVLTDGEDEGSRLGLGKVLDRARAEEIMVYAIGLESEFVNGGIRMRSRPDGGLQKLAAETGGGYFELRKADELGPTFTRVAQELHSLYEMGFSPSVLDGKVHKLTLKVKKQGLSARARKSYVASDRAGGDAVKR